MDISKLLKPFYNFFKKFDKFIYFPYIKILKSLIIEFSAILYFLISHHENPVKIFNNENLLE